MSESLVPNVGDEFDRHTKLDNGAIEVKHYIIDDQGNEVEVNAEQLPDGTFQDTEYSETPAGN